MAATTTRANTTVAPNKRPRTGSPTPHRYQIAIEHQTPIDRMAMASRAKPVQRVSRQKNGFTSLSPQLGRSRSRSAPALLLARRSGGGLALAPLPAYRGRRGIRDAARYCWHPPGKFLEQNPTDLANCQRVTLGRVSGAFDHKLGLHPIDVGALVFHHAVVAGLQRSVLQRRNDGVSVDAGRNRDLAQRLDRRVAGRHAAETVEGPELQRVPGAGQYVGGCGGDGQWQLHQPAEQADDRQTGLVAAPMGGGYEDHRL